MLYLNDFLEEEREIVLRYTYYLIRREADAVWFSMDSFLKEYYPSLAPPASSKKKESAILFLDNAESIAIIDSLTKQDPALELICPHRRYKEGLGSIFVLQELSWETVGIFLDFLAGVVRLRPEVYQLVTPLVLQENHQFLSFKSPQINR